MMNLVRGPLLVTPPGADAGGRYCVRGPLVATVGQTSRKNRICGPLWANLAQGRKSVHSRLRALLGLRVPLARAVGTGGTLRAWRLAERSSPRLRRRDGFKTLIARIPALCR